MTGSLKVRTAALLAGPPDVVWPLLCDSRMVLPARCPVFYLGAPQPVACQVPIGTVEAGAQRQCVSAQGTVSQRITQAQPGRLLAFHMEDTDLHFRTCVTELSDVFELAPTADGAATRIVRTTRVQVRGQGRMLKYGALFVALKSVHRYVFRNWTALLTPDSASSRRRRAAGW